MSLVLYRFLTGVLGPAVGPFLSMRRRKGKEDPARVGERRGLYTVSRPQGLLFWFHAASVGETNSAFPLIEKVLAAVPQARVLLTTGTVTSASLVEKRAIPGVMHQYCPVDTRRHVRRFLEHWRPDASVWIESELWPNLVAETHARGVPMALVNARLSRRSQARWARVPGFFRRMMSHFRLVLCQSGGDVQAFHTLGVDHAQTVGNLKYSAAPLAVDPATLTEMEQGVAGRRCWVAASTHPGEEAMVGRAHGLLKKVFPDLLAIVVPRHPHRGAEVADLFDSQGLNVARRTVQALPPADCDVYVADTLGELGLFFSLAPIAYVGGGMGTHGGHNPIEPALFHSAILYGPDRGNFREVAGGLEAEDAALVVETETDLAARVEELLTNPEAAAAMADRAAAVAAANRRIVDDVFERLKPCLPMHVESP